LLAVLPLLPGAAGLLSLLLTGVLSVVAAAAALRPAALARLGRIVWRQKPGILVLAVGLAVAAAALVEGHKRSQVSEESTHVPRDFSAGRWPMFRGSLTRTGHADEAPGPSRGSVQWSGGHGFVFLSSPAVVGDTLVVVGSRRDNSARFFCFSASRGDLLWTLAPAGFRATFSSPVVADDHLLCGEGVHTTRGACVRGFKVGAAGALAPALKYATTSHIECTPAIEADRVYFGAGDDGVYCLDFKSDRADRLVWHAPGERYPDVETALAVYDGRVYVGLGRGGDALCVLDANSGNEVARLPMPLPVFSPPAVAEGRLYLGMGSADYVNGARNSPGEVRCLELKSLETLWTLQTPSPVLAALVVRDDDVIFATVAGEVFVVDGNGAVKHRWQAGGRVLAAPAVTPDAIYCVSCDGLLTALDRRLQRVFSTRLGAPGLFISSPVVYAGRIYVGTPADGFVAVGTPAGPAS
jgi:outer membrane protein assembly factor BamB